MNQTERMNNIKYCDISNGYHYGEDGKALSDWNPDKDYGGEYASVYFYIDTPIYQYPFDNYTREEMDAFYEEANGILAKFGFGQPEEKYVVGITCGKERLYTHPQTISGEVKKNRVKEIAEALAKATLFSLRWVSIGKTYYDMTDEEFYHILEAKRPDMEERIKELATTKRKDYYKSAEGIAKNVGSSFFVCRVGARNNDTSKDEVTAKEYAMNLIRQMIENGALKSSTSKDGTFIIRTIKEKERTAAKKAAMAMC